MALPLELEPAQPSPGSQINPDPVGSNGNEAKPVRTTGNGSHVKARPEAFIPPAPPNFDDEESTFLPPPTDETEDDDLDQVDPEVRLGQEAQVEPRKTVVVEIKAVRNWKSVCRQIVKMMETYEGQDILNIKIAGKALQMEFPNLGTRVCSESIAEIEELSAVKRVRIL
jgi:hypothetical protein